MKSCYIGWLMLSPIILLALIGLGISCYQSFRDYVSLNGWKQFWTNIGWGAAVFFAWAWGLVAIILISNC